MALQTIGKTNTGKKFFNPSKAATGESVEGYYLGTKAKENSKYANALVIVLKGLSGQEILVDVQGTLRYIQQNAEEAGQTITIGAYTVITKTGTYTNKTNQKVSPAVQFAQDTERMLEGAVETVATQTAAAAASTESIEARLAKKKASA